MNTKQYPYKVTRGNVTTFHATEKAAIKEAAKRDAWIFRHDPFSPRPDHFDESGMWVAFDIPKVATCTVQFEYTDTFGGEANYSWVRRHEATFPADISDRALVRRAKAWAGLTNCRCRTENLGDLIALYPQGSCTVLFISTVY